jgi:hypothetical protein
MRQRALWSKRGGVPGIPDLFLAKPMGEYHGLYIEMKSVDHKPKKAVAQDWHLNIAHAPNGKPTTSYGVSSTQSEVMNTLSRNGYKCIVCFGYDDTIKTITNYLMEKAQ